MNKNSRSTFHIVKKTNQPLWKMVLYYVIAILIAMVIGAVLLASMGVDFVEFYKQMLTMGIPGNKFAYKSVEGLIKVFVPLLITSLALSMAYKMKFWNVGGEGQFIIGALMAALIAIQGGDSLPTIVILPLMCIAGGLSAGIYGMIPALLKVRFNTSETLMTLMMNYIALYILVYFGQNKTSWNFFLRDDSERPVFRILPESTFMPGITIGRFTLNISLILALLFTAFMIVYLTKTKHGYEVSVVGDSINTAYYAGMKVKMIIVRTIFFSAFMVGVAGAFHVSTSHALSETITNDVGWTGVIVAWLSKLNPVGILITSLLISILQYGCQVANTDFANVDTNFADLMQGIILFAVLVADFTLRFKLVRIKKTKEDEA